MLRESAVLHIRNLDKKFPGVHALKEVSFSVQRGQIHGLVGENGAGKSTLIKCITGAYTYDSGEILFIDEKGIKTRVDNPLSAKKIGIAAVYQDLMVAPELTVGENFFVGRLPRTALKTVNWKYIYSYAAKTLQEYGIQVNPKTPMKNLTVSQQTMVTIAKLSCEQAKLIIFDEPTALLPNQEVQTLYNILRKLKEKGVSMIYISHRLDEIMEICDCVTVLKDGEVVDTRPIADLDESKLISMMVGRTMSQLYTIEKSSPGEVVLEVEHLTRAGVFKDISFNLHKGEVLGFFGLIGSGRTEVMRCLYGADRYHEGKISLHGKELCIKGVRDAQKAGIGLIPEDRRGQGLALGMDVAHNINMADMGSVSQCGLVHYKKFNQRCKNFMDRLRIKAYSGKQVVRNLSGGNQQKVVIAKALSGTCDILIMDEPTVGVDVGAKLEIYQLIGDLVKDGKTSVIFVSSYLPELLGISDRIIVFHEGRLTGELTNEEIHAMSSPEAEETILTYASGYAKG